MKANRDRRQKDRKTERQKEKKNDFVPDHICHLCACSLEAVSAGGDEQRSPAQSRRSSSVVHPVSLQAGHQPHRHDSNGVGLGAKLKALIEGKPIKVQRGGSCALVEGKQIGGRERGREREGEREGKRGLPIQVQGGVYYRKVETELTGKAHKACPDGKDVDLKDVGEVDEHVVGLVDAADCVHARGDNEVCPSPLYL